MTMRSCVVLAAALAAALAVALAPSPAAADVPSAAEAAALLAEHNSARAAKCVPALAWDAALAVQASDYAGQCTWAHSAASSRPGAGENLYANAGGGLDFAGGVRSWNGEESDWNCASNSCSDVCGHYTQVVWENTQRVGCGWKACSTGSPFSGFSNWNILVCQYSPPGNYVGQHPFGTDQCANCGTTGTTGAASANGDANAASSTHSATSTMVTASGMATAAYMAA